MSRIIVAGEQETIPNQVGSASSLERATVVRLVNKGNTNRVVTIVEGDTSNDVVGSFTMLGNASDMLEKQPWQRVYVAAGTDVVGTKVGFSN
tara:strand:- start:187 stop:462 length:276 start_codon:yes stop_codon:yes gene_type:complete